MDWASLGSGVIGALIGAVASIALTVYSERRRDKNHRIGEVRTRSERAAVEALDLSVQLRDLADEPEMGAPHSPQMKEWHAWNDRRSALIAQLEVRTHMVAHTASKGTSSSWAWRRLAKRPCFRNLIRSSSGARPATPCLVSKNSGVPVKTQSMPG